VRSVKEEALSRLILFGERSLLHALTQYDAHYHTERPHQGLGNVVLLRPRREPAGRRFRPSRVPGIALHGDVAQELECPRPEASILAPTGHCESAHGHCYFAREHLASAYGLTMEAALGSGHEAARTLLARLAG
jgi:hypothetical protein